MADKTPEQFMEYFRANYPGPDTIICKPDWHAPKIYRAALKASAFEDLYVALKDMLVSNVHGAAKSCGHDYPCVCTEAKARAALKKADGVA